MKTYPYNRTSSEGRKLFRLLDNQYNPGVLETQVFGDKDNTEIKQFESYTKSAVMQCRANAVSLILSSNLSGVKRPQIHIDGEVEMAWGDFTNTAQTLDFTHGEELPITFVQPLEDETLKALVDAGLYSDPRFEELISKLITDEPFDVEGDMAFNYIDVGDAVVNQGKTGSIPVILVDPVNIVHEDKVESEYTTVSKLVNRSAALIIELRKEGVQTDELVTAQLPEQDQEVYISSDFTDVIAQREADLAENEVVIDSDNGQLATGSELLDVEVDVTDKLAGSISFSGISEDDIIRELKEKDRERAYSGVDSIDLSEVDLDNDTISIDTEPERQSTVFDFNVEQGNISDQKPNEVSLDADAFDGQSLDDFDFEDDEDELER